MSRKMKDSGVEWIGEIPEGWDVKRLKSLYNASMAGEVIPKEYWNDGSLLTYTCAKNPLYSNYSMFPSRKLTSDHDLLLTRNATPYVFIPRNGCGYSNVVQKITVNSSVFRAYLKYAIECSMKSMAANGNIIPSLNMHQWNKLYIALPATLEKQQAIANYLDTKVGEIDANISKLKSASTLLSELKQSVIYEAVTGKTFEGKVIDRKMKDSEIEWVGEIPEGWGVNRIAKCRIEIKTGKEDASFAEPSGDYEFYTCSVSSFKCSVPAFKGPSLILAGNGDISNIKLHPNDSAFNAYQRVYVLTNKDEKLFLKYMYYVFKAGFYQNTVSQLKGSVIEFIKLGFIKNFVMPVSPLSEQQAIADYLDRKVGEIDDKIAIIERKIELLSELKQSVIYEAVTGKIDVRAFELSAEGAIANKTA